MSEFVRCPKCDGEGVMVRARFEPFTCWVCDGTGKIDWVTNVMGKKGYGLKKFPEDFETNLNWCGLLKLEKRIKGKI